MNNINLYGHPVLLSFESDRRTRRADYLSQAFKRHLVSSNLTGHNAPTSQTGQDKQTGEDRTGQRSDSIERTDAQNGNFCVIWNYHNSEQELKWATVATIDMYRKEGGLLCPFREELGPV